jgi:hypothetical protein
MMDEDLQDLLAAWHGAEGGSEGRRAQLLARLRADAPFREAFIGEIRMLGMLKAVQAPEPRWLELGEELGRHRGKSQETEAPDDFADAVMRKINAPPRWVWVGIPPWAMAAIAAAIPILAGVAFWWAGRGFHGQNPEAVDHPRMQLAVVAHLDAGRELSDDGLAVHEGDVVSTGRLRLKSGAATLSFFNGATLYVEGETDADLVAMDRVACRKGRLRLRAESGTSGFTITGPGVAVVDLGTEFALNVGTDGRAAVRVFEGQVEASLLGRDGYTLRSELLNQDESASMAAGGDRLIRNAEPASEFASARPMAVKPLALAHNYADLVRSAHPWGYWRCETIGNGETPNEVPGGLPLRVNGPIRLNPEANGNHALLFSPATAEAYALMEGTWQPAAGTDYAVEVWVMPEGVRLSAVASLIAEAPLDQREKHLFLLQLMDRSQRWLHPNGTVRFLHRSPPDFAGGVNAFADHAYVPGRWLHVVAQKRGAQLELYLNGRLAGAAAADAGPAAGAYRLLLGRLKQAPQAKLENSRPFVGRLDELALYEHALAPEEIAQHAAMPPSPEETSPP